MTELETMLLRQLTSLSNECVQQFELQARRLSGCEKQLLQQSEMINTLLHLVARLTAQLSDLSAQLESEA